ncbi:MAG: glutaredoxin 3 [Zetaproteobacteria bacterium CG_4_9_14_3_um_filter_49_83]|nr:MAG: glutaredoxin 3 [Zetaproteobacteria bacterium CG1_02_49_23]PIQ30160.1 MAG: glutaredoxin 3 [Zetaproteobacteria bacterium CG17_big_fil_post_rev_8_21_14_2_50_50_13]PIV31350.1 MAG: glutaredoxin 3 [Zetaproteobacteria bacterium CG02_land_8_20_14_3_00_50_9]PIY54520.1 MAG: glutaredoxin 3 [Zetaproteobacteria bacterium CG_4_10_14_0_8_um_filter_49_80]PJA35160.1 MAG: glutaredoxin 3 [Zetaproteobacteria bacterium CG_4_9_14_3_um_filter_49_83]
MAKIEVYSGDYCPYCVRAKTLLKKKNLEFIEYNVQLEPERRQEMAARAPGVRTIPQIFINDRHVGGCDDLYALERKGEIESWLNC